MARDNTISMPAALETEAEILGVCLAEGMSWWIRASQHLEVSSILDLFYEEDHRIVARAFEKVAEEGGNLTLSTVGDVLLRDPSAERLVPDPRSFLLSLQTRATISSLEELSNSLNVLNQKAQLRHQIVELETMVTKIAEDEPHPNEIISSLKTFSMTGGMAEGIERFGDRLAKLDEEQDDEPTHRMRTNLPDLDVLFRGGIDPGRLIVMAARPKVGKTTQLLNMTLEALSQGYVVIFASLEIQERELQAKLTAAQAGVDHIKIDDYVNRVKGREIFTDEEYDAVVEADRGIRNSDFFPMFSRDVPHGVDSVISNAIKVAQKYPDRPLMIAVDYIQLLAAGHGESEHQALNSAARKLKLLSQEADAVLLVASQLNRDGVEGMPSPHQLRGSGGLEEHADAVVLMNRPHLQDETQPDYLFQMHVALNRIYKTGWVDANWQPAIQTVSDIGYVTGDFPDEEPVRETVRAERVERERTPRPSRTENQEPSDAPPEIPASPKTTEPKTTEPKTEKTSRPKKRPEPKASDEIPDRTKTDITKSRAARTRRASGERAERKPRRVLSEDDL